MAIETIQIAENMVRSLLKSLGYFKIVTEESSDGSLKIFADGDLRNIALEVKLIRSPKESLSNKEIRRIKQIASENDREPWAAKLRINAEGKLVNGIEWKNLSTL